ncbi:AI-2E family transporter [Globicatella sulfidifaciens]
MKINRQLVLVWGLILASIYVVYRYWGAAEEILMTVFNASKPFFVGAMIAYIVNILMDGYGNLITRFVSFQPILKMKRKLSLFLAYLTFASAIIVILGIVIPELIRAIQSLLSIDPKTIQQIFKSMEDNGIIKQIIGLIQGDTSGNVDIVSTITGYVQQILNSIGNLLLGILTSATGIFSTVINVFMSIVFSIYVLISKDKLSVQFTNVLKAYVPDWYQTIEATIDVFNQSFRGFIVSQTIEAVILGSLCFVGMLILRLPYASTVSIMIGSTSLIPLVGAFIGATIGVVLILTQSVSQAFIFIIFIIVLQQVESNLIYPRVVGGSVGLPPMWVLVAISIGGAIANIFGMFVAVPIAAALYKLFRDDLQKRLANQTLT